jgi:phage tail tape-measure protein
MEIAANKSGNVPQAARDGAAYLLSHQSDWAAISHRTGSEGKACAGDFDRAATGEIAGLGDDSEEGRAAMPEDQAARVLGEFASSHGLHKLDANLLSDLAQNKSGTVPEGLQRAAATVLARASHHASEQPAPAADHHAGEIGGGLGGAAAGAMAGGAVAGPIGALIGGLLGGLLGKSIGHDADEGRH